MNGQMTTHLPELRAFPALALQCYSDKVAGTENDIITFPALDIPLDLGRVGGRQPSVCPCSLLPKSGAKGLPGLEAG